MPESVYPGAIDSFPSLPDSLAGPPKHSEVHDTIHSALLAIENALGVNPGNRIDAAVSAANQATSTANTAKSTADSAKTTANTALTTANTAKTTADTAKSTADTAKTSATSATSTANTALSTANTAKTSATSATTTANAATTTANAATTTANTAKTTADTSIARFQCGFATLNPNTNGYATLTLPATMGSTQWSVICTVASSSNWEWYVRPNGTPSSGTQILLGIWLNGALADANTPVYYIAFKTD